MDDVVKWLSAVGTLFAVIVALFKEEIVRLWRRPRLDARIALRSPDCEKIEIQVSTTPQLQFSGTNAEGLLSVTGNIVAPPIWRGEAFFFRVWIENNGRQRAEKVQVFASRLKLKYADSIFRPVESFLPMNLRWTHSQSNVPEIFADINPSMGRHCDLGSISDPKNPTQTPLRGLDGGQVSFDLALEVFPNTQSHRLPPGCYQLEMRLAAANARPVVKTIEINFSGRWHADVADMFKSGIGIKEV
jgi:hypothetical protein